MIFFHSLLWWKRVLSDVYDSWWATCLQDAEKNAQKFRNRNCWWFGSLGFFSRGFHVGEILDVQPRCTRPAFTIMVGGVWTLRFRMKNSPFGFLKCQKFWGVKWWEKNIVDDDFYISMVLSWKLSTTVVLMFIVFCYPSSFRNAILQLFGTHVVKFASGVTERSLNSPRKEGRQLELKWTQMDPDIRYEWKMAWKTTGYSIQRRDTWTFKGVPNGS